MPASLWARYPTARYQPFLHSMTLRISDAWAHISAPFNPAEVCVPGDEGFRVQGHFDIKTVFLGDRRVVEAHLALPDHSMASLTATSTSF